MGIVEKDKTLNVLEIRVSGYYNEKPRYFEGYPKKKGSIINRIKSNEWHKECNNYIEDRNLKIGAG